MKLYLDEIAKTPLLSRDEEIALAARIAAGDPEARDHLVRANLRLVVTNAKRMYKLGCSLPDMIAEGNLGLIRAAECFDPSHGARFSTYASWWIRQSIGNLKRREASLMPAPGYLAVRIGRYERTASLLAQKLDHTPTEDEIFEAARIEEEHRAKVTGWFSRPTVAHAHWIGESVDGENEPAEEPSDREEIVDQVRAGTDRLDERLRKIVVLRYGLDGDEPKTLRQVAAIVGLTAEGVRQLEKIALGKLREQMAA